MVEGEWDITKGFFKKFFLAIKESIKMGKDKKPSTFNDRIDDQAKGIISNINPETDKFFEEFNRKNGITPKKSKTVAVGGKTFEVPELQLLCEKCGTTNYFYSDNKPPYHCDNCGKELKTEPLLDDFRPDEWA